MVLWGVVLVGIARVANRLRILSAQARTTCAWMADLAHIAPVYRDAALIACHYLGMGLASRMPLETTSVASASRQNPSARLAILAHLATYFVVARSSSRNAYSARISPCRPTVWRRWLQNLWSPVSPCFRPPVRGRCARGAVRAAGAVMADTEIVESSNHHHDRDRGLCQPRRRAGVGAHSGDRTRLNAARARDCERHPDLP